MRISPAHFLWRLALRTRCRVQVAPLNSECDRAILLYLHLHRQAQHRRTATGLENAKPSDRRQHGLVRPFGAGNMTGAELRAGLAVTLPGPPRACTVDVAGVIDPRDNKTTLAGNSTLAWTPTACGSSAVVIYSEC